MVVKFNHNTLSFLLVGGYNRSKEVIIMSVIKNVLKEEESRLLHLQQIYLKKIAEFPRGSIQKKRIYNHDYHYLVYRNPKERKQILKLIKDNNTLIELKSQIEERKHFEKLLKDLEQELKLVRKVLSK